MDRNPIPPLTSTVNKVLDETAKRVRNLERQEVDTWLPQLLPLLLPNLRAYWPFSSADENDNVLDVSGQGRTLTPNGGVVRSITAGFIPYADFDAVNDYYARADEAGLDFTTALTVGFHGYVNAGGGTYTFIGKYGAAGNRSWRIYHDPTIGTTGGIRFQVSGDGTALVSVASAGITEAKWHHIVAMYDGGNSLSLLVDGILTTNTTGVPATLFDSSAPLELGRSNATDYLDGNLAMVWLASSAYSEALAKAIYNHVAAALQVS